ncbi:site-specific DNA-methyltransferase, partial [candidate division KSB1 bacterium]|nr:site-specific DNA-methyltransferase [candidate division KSB1 bacterium]
LDSKIARQSGFKSNKVQLIESEACSHRLFVCLDPKIKEDTIKHLELRTEDIFVCLDSAITDQAKMRLADICRLDII